MWREAKEYPLLRILFGIILSLLFIVFPHVQAAKTLETILGESNPIAENAAHFNVGRGASTMEQDGNKLYVANSGGGIDFDTVSVIDTDTMKVSNIPVGKIASTLSLDLNHDVLYVVNKGSGSVSVINRTNSDRIRDIPVGEGPSDLVWNPFEDKVYVSNLFSNSVSVINGTNYSKITEIPVGKHPTHLLLQDTPPPRNILFVVNSNAGLDSNSGGTVSVINGTNYSKITEIPVGKRPSYIMPGIGYKLLFVVNSGSDTVSVINDISYSKITEIPVGKNPTRIMPGPDGALYVINSDSGTVSVINGTNYSKITEIRVGKGPSDILVASGHTEFHGGEPVFKQDNTIYVINSDSGTVSVINGTNYSKITEIRVGKHASNINFDPSSNIIYVTNPDSGTVTAIDGKTHNILAGISFDVNPFQAGQVICKNVPVSTNQYLFLDSHGQCMAKSNNGFHFTNWVEKLGHNSSRIINSSAGSDLLGSLFTTLGIEPRDTPENLSTTRFGNFTANFEKLPPPIPPEYLAPLYGIIVSSIIGWSIPNIVGWLRSKGQRKHLEECLNQIGKLDREKIEEKITKLYVQGKLNDSHHRLLNDKIAEYYEIVKDSKRSPI
jgi:YVTN family beta-propeller protein